MKKKQLLLYFLLCASMLSFSQVKNLNDTINKTTAAPKDRNMFGLHIPRGLKVNSEGLAD